MRDRIRNAFDKIQAEPELKQRTARFLAEKILQQPARKKVLPLRRVALLCTVLAVFLLGAGFFHSYYTVSAAISIDGASSLELEINCFDRVISVTGYGSSSQSLADSLEVKHQNYRQAVETILEDERIREFLEEGELLILTVSGTDAEQSDEIFQEMESDTAEEENIRCQAGNAAEAQAAREAGLSLGKYRAYLELLELDPYVTPGDVSSLTMREIRDWIAELGGSENGRGGGYRYGRSR